MKAAIKWQQIARFFIPGTPKPQPRPRFGRGRAYNPGTADAWKGLIVVLGNRHKPRKPLSGPVRVDIVFLFDHHTSKSRAAEHPYRTPHIEVPGPDRDNLDKAVLDAMARARWYGNDCQVCHGTIEKWWKADGEKSGAEITVSVPAEKGASHDPLASSGLCGSRASWPSCGVHLDAGRADGRAASTAR